MKINVRRKLFASKSRCEICGSTKNLEIDHIIPKSRGGSDSSGNLQILCSRCNSKKRDKLLPHGDKMSYERK